MESVFDSLDHTNRQATLSFGTFLILTLFDGRESGASTENPLTASSLIGPVAPFLNQEQGNGLALSSFLRQHPATQHAGPMERWPLTPIRRAGPKMCA